MVFAGLLAIATFACGLSICSQDIQADVALDHLSSWRRARNLGQNQHIFSFGPSYRHTESRFTNTGKTEPVGRRMGRALTWGQLLAAEKSNEGRAAIRSHIQNRGLGESDIAASTNYQLERHETAFTANWAYGILRSWTLGVRIPISYRFSKVKSRVDVSPAGMDEKMRARVRQLADQNLEDAGYTRIEDKEEWVWGDTNLLSQFELLHNYRWTWAFQQLIRFPTTQNPDSSDYLQPESDDGQLDVGVTSLLDYQRRFWIFGARLGYVYQSPDRMKRRMPDSNSAFGSLESTVRRDLGDYFWGAVDAQYRMSRHFNLNVEYAALSKAGDRYESQSGVVQTVGSDVQQTRAGLIYDIGPVSTRSGVQNKWTASLDHTIPWTGRNTVDASLTSLEIIKYF